ncbi:MAG: hypothetical protein ABIK96_12675 [bacterium]|nr:hypothetical protein [bacterium]
MSHKLLTVILCAVSLIIGLSALAQDDPQDRVFKLLRDSAAADAELDLEDEELEAWQPGLDEGVLEFSFAMGVLGLSTTILEHEQMIYKYTDEATYWGDVALEGQGAFNPALRLGYHLNSWLALEGLGGLSFSTYSSKITNRHRRPNEQGAPVDFAEPALLEFDAEERSLITLQAGLNAVLYPLSIGGEGKGKWHPYLTAGAGRIWYDMNSNYNEGMVGSMNLNAGGGIRLLADRNISLRFEVLFHRHSLQWDPAANFMELDEGTLLIPLNEYPLKADGSFEESHIESFDSIDMNLLNYSIGVQGSF